MALGHLILSAIETALVHFIANGESLFTHKSFFFKSQPGLLLSLLGNV